VLSLKNELHAPYRSSLKVRWFDAWHPILDEALHDLPELDSCSHDLFRLVIQNRGPSRKRIALVTEKGIPVAVVGLRQKGRFDWEPVLQWIVPGEPFPSKPGYIMRAIEALNIEVWVAWWRVKEPPTTMPLMRYLESTPTYKMHCSDDIEQYWRDNGYFKTIRRMRNRCKDYTLSVNPPGSAEWTIKNWEAKWRENPTKIDPSLADRIMVAKYQEERGLYFTLMLLDQDIPIGGATVLVDQKDLVAAVLYSKPEYRSNGVGDRLIDLCFTLAIEKGFETFDIGGGHEYKRHWASQEGERWWFNVCPEPLYKIKQVTGWVRGLHKKKPEDVATSN
jgi:GNAT superfamily N-acetyltransferase